MEHTGHLQSTGFLHNRELAMEDKLCKRGRAVLAPFSPQFGWARASINKDHNSCVSVKVHSPDLD